MVNEKSQQLQFPQLVEIETLAGLLSISIRHLRDLVTKQEIPCWRVGRFLRFDLIEVFAALEARRQPARPTPRASRKRDDPHHDKRAAPTSGLF
jgi:excisionase family DNA binding protein